MSIVSKVTLSEKRTIFFFKKNLNRLKTDSGRFGTALQKHFVSMYCIVSKKIADKILAFVQKEKR